MILSYQFLQGEENRKKVHLINVFLICKTPLKWYHLYAYSLSNEEKIKYICHLYKYIYIHVCNSEQVAENNGKDGKPIWMSYGGVVYDVSDFIYNHPGGSERIMLAAGSVRYYNAIFFFSFF